MYGKSFVKKIIKLIIAGIIDHFYYSRSYPRECNVLYGLFRGFHSKNVRNVFCKLLFKTKILNNMHKETKCLPGSSSTTHEFLIYK